MAFIRSAGIIICRTMKNINGKYELLMMQRTTRMKSFAGKIAFPGGAISKADSDPRWMDLLSSRFSASELEGLIPQQRMRTFTDMDDGSGLTAEIAYRICAIREMFEETGVLLALNANGRTTADTGLSEDWQKQVAADASVFMDAMRFHKMVPDLLRLHEWNQWLTPLIASRRFITAFYLCMIDGPIAMRQNDEEAEQLLWLTPTNALNQYYSDSSNRLLAPPQIADLSEFASRYPTVESLRMEAERKQREGVLLNYPIHTLLSDGAMMVLRGDDRFPLTDKVDLDSSLNLTSFSVADVSKDVRQRRMMMKDGQTYYVDNLLSFD